MAKDPEFGYIIDDMKRFKERLAQNQLSLNEKVRKEEKAEDEKRKKERDAERKKHPFAEPIAYEVTLDTVDKPELPKVTKKKKPAAEKVAKAKDDDDDDADEEKAPDAPDPIRHEALNILKDLTGQYLSLRTAKASQGE